MEIAISGWYGMKNMGDDAFCWVLNWAIPRYWGVDSFRFIAPPIADLPSQKFYMPECLYQNNSKISRIKRNIKTLRLLMNTDLLLYGGGSVFRGMTLFSEKRLHAVLSDITKLKTAALGVSIGPFKDRVMEKRVTQVLKRMEYVSVRDQLSASYFRSLGLQIEPIVAADLVGLLPDVLGKLPKRDTGKPRLGVSLLGIDFAISTREAEIREKHICDGIVEYARKNNLSVTVFILNENDLTGDYPISSRLINKLKENKVSVTSQPYSVGLPAIWSSIGTCDAFFHTRLHGGLLSYVAQKPFALIPYAAKNENFLDDIGQHSTLRLPYDGGSSSEVKKILGRLFNNPPPPKITQEQYHDLAELNMTSAPWVKKLITHEE